MGLPDRYISADFSHTEEEFFQTIEAIGGAFYIEKIKISDLVAALISPGEAFILVDENKWGVGEIMAGRRAIPFLERDGQYWGLPPDDDTAIRELDRLRQSGASFVVFGYPALWWLDYYGGFSRYLCSKFRCVLQHDRLVVFKLQWLNELS